MGVAPITLPDRVTVWPRAAGPIARATAQAMAATNACGETAVRGNRLCEDRRSTQASSVYSENGISVYPVPPASLVARATPEGKEWGALRGTMAAAAVPSTAVGAPRIASGECSTAALQPGEIHKRLASGLLSDLQTAVLDGGQAGEAAEQSGEMTLRGETEVEGDSRQRE